MGELFSNVSEDWIILLSVNFLILLIVLISNFLNARKIKLLKQKYNKFMNGLSEKNIEELIENCIDNVNEVRIKNREIENKINYVERNIIQCVQKVGVIRYNAFDNVGSDLSFAIALLDSNDTGVVISSIYSRDSSSTYAKSIIAGKSKYTLSAEEIQAIDIAKKNHREKLYLE